MAEVINTKDENKWLRPWDVTEFNDLYNRDERFFSIIIKGLLGYLTRNIKMYNKPIKHYILNTGSSYMYVESNGYDYSWNEVSGEDWMYSELPRATVEIGGLNIPMEELSQSYSRGYFERKDSNNMIRGYNAEMKRMPIEMTFNIHYTFGTFNESIVVLQELVEKVIFQKYFKISYLGQIINCSIEFPNQSEIQFNKPDFSSSEKTQKNIDLSVTLCTNYPVINEKSAIEASKRIKGFAGYLDNSNDGGDVIIKIDGVTSYRDEIYFDISKYDLNNDGVVDENELSIIREFIDTCDLDEDGFVTSHDINLITEIFMQNTYNINFDILKIGAFDMKNLIAIKKLFKLLDLNNDNNVSDEETNQIINIINKINKIKLGNKLTIGYNDLINIIQFVNDHKDVTFINIMKEFNVLLENHIKNQYNELYVLIIQTIRNQQYENLIEIINEYVDVIEQEIYEELLDYINTIIDFKKYDINDDGVINDEDIQMFIDVLSEIVGKTITYYTASAIYLHSSGGVNDKSTITDKVEYKKI